ncbi:MAG: 50S ribosomal protein L18Ae [Candidatus Micrarchaeota archaeon]|nr:50S ribosomal protein L18Ae [Candidatus Micrarchaeota archaeon]
MAKFIVVGKIGKGASARPFEKVVEAESQKLALEKAMALFGSNAGIKRAAIKIESIEKI